MRCFFTSTYWHTPQLETSQVASSSLAICPNCDIGDYRKIKSMLRRYHLRSAPIAPSPSSRYAYLRRPGMHSSRDPGLGFSFWFIREAKFKKLWIPARRHTGMTEGGTMLNKNLDPGISKRIRNSSSTMVNLKSFPDRKSALLTTAHRGDAGLDPGSRNALEMVRALWIILIIFLTENGALPISKRTRNSADTMVYL